MTDSEFDSFDRALLTELRQVAAEPAAAPVRRTRKRWAYVGTGHKTLGDAWLAEVGAARAAERRRIAREELRAGPAGAVLSGDVQPNTSRRQS